MWKRRDFVWLALASLSSAPSGAHAGEPEGRAEARQLAEQGDTAFSEGRCDRAIDLWRRAVARYDAPSIRVRIAQCQALLGRIVDASDTLEQVAGERLQADAPAAFADAQSRARAELPKLQARIARLHLVIERRGLPVTPTVEIDNAPMPKSDGPYRLDPGDHFIHVRASNGVWDKTIHMNDGEDRTLKVRMVPDSSSGPFFTPSRLGYVLGGTGIVTMGIGAAFGVMALQSKDELGATCDADLSNCDPSKKGVNDNLRTQALAADLLLGTGLLMVGGGVTLILLDKTRQEGPRVRLIPMGAGAAVEGRF